MVSACDETSQNYSLHHENILQAIGIECLLTNFGFQQLGRKIQLLTWTMLNHRRISFSPMINNLWENITLSCFLSFDLLVGALRNFENSDNVEMNVISHFALPVLERLVTFCSNVKFSKYARSINHFRYIDDLKIHVH